LFGSKLRQKIKAENQGRKSRQKIDQMKSVSWFFLKLETRTVGATIPLEEIQDTLATAFNFQDITNNPKTVKFIVDFMTLQVKVQLPLQRPTHTHSITQ
jgi:hypothetical protein